MVILHFVTFDFLDLTNGKQISKKMNTYEQEPIEKKND